MSVHTSSPNLFYGSCVLLDQPITRHLKSWDSHLSCPAQTDSAVRMPFTLEEAWNWAVPFPCCCLLLQSNCLQGPKGQWRRVTFHYIAYRALLYASALLSPHGLLWKQIPARFISVSLQALALRLKSQQAHIALAYIIIAGGGANLCQNFALVDTIVFRVKRKEQKCCAKKKWIHSLHDFGDGLAFLQLIHWAVVGRGWVRLLGSEVSISFRLRDSHSLNVNVYQEVQLPLHRHDLRNRSQKGKSQFRAGGRQTTTCPKRNVGKLTTTGRPNKLPVCNLAWSTLMILINVLFSL